MSKELLPVDPILAVPILYRDVQAVFAEDYADGGEISPVVFDFGWTKEARQDNQAPTTGNRIVFVPGDDKDGRAGDDVAARWPGDEFERPIANLDEVFTVYLWAYDSEAPEGPDYELFQYTAARLLYDAFRRACYLKARQTFKITAIKWQTDNRKLRAKGAELRLVCSIQCKVPDKSAGATILVRPVEATTQARSGDVSETMNT